MGSSERESPGSLQIEDDFVAEVMEEITIYWYESGAYYDTDLEKFTEDLWEEWERKLRKAKNT